MNLRASTLVAAVLTGLLGVSAGAEDRTHRRLERVLSERRAARGERSVERARSLAARLAELERRHQAQRAEFDRAAAHDLPPKAAERLARTRAAWEAGQGRLLRLLRRLSTLEPEAAEAVRPAGPSRRGARTAPEPTRSPDADLDEALVLLRRLRRASRGEPLSAGELKVTAPELVAPALAVGPGTQAAPGDAAPPIGSIAPEVRRMAETFDGPVAAYEWVRNAIQPEFYHGVMKGPRQTLLEGGGNDADTASLLIGLLRAMGLPARYVRGTVDLPAALAVAMTGTASPERALRVFQRAGIPSEAVLGTGAIAALRVERVWTEAYIPYVNYRGVLLDAHEKTWVPLDAGLKRLEIPGGLDVRTLGFEPEAFLEDYLAAPVALTPRELVRQRVETLLASERSGLAYEDVLVSRGVRAQSLGLLPSTLPYAIEARAEVGYDPPASLVHTARFVLESDQGALLDTELSLPSLLGHRLTLSYVPFEEDDEVVVSQYGGLFETPPYLVEVRPVLKRGGVVVGSATTGAGLGVKLDFRIELTTPGGTGLVQNRVLAGNLTAIGLAQGPATGFEEGDDEAARILGRLALRYLDAWDASDTELAALLRVVPVRPTASACLVQSAVQVEYAGGDPLYPVGYDWKGLAIDADRRPSAPVGIEDDGAERDFLLLSGLEGSVLEARLFEDDLGIPAVSTASALQLAPGQGVAVLDLGADAATILPGLTLDDGVKDEILEATAAGYRVRVPESSVSLLAWSGVGYLILDPDTGESAWQLQGGHSGGITAPAVINLPQNVVDAVRRQTETPESVPQSVTFIQKFDTTDFQESAVATPLEKPLKVLVTDAEGFPVPGVPVTFSVLGGGGVLVDPATGRATATEVTVFSCTGEEEEGPCVTLRPGEAVASLTLGIRTDAIPRFTCEEPFTCTCPSAGECDRDAVGYATQVGMNLVTARSGSVALAEPFTAFGYPERLPADGGGFQVFMTLQSPPRYNPVNLTVVDRLALSVTDRHGNPLSNVLTRVSFDGPPVLGPAPPGGSLLREATTTPGHVLDAHDYERCVSSHPSVVWGECPGEAETVITLSSRRGVFVYPILGDSPWSLYFYDFGTTLSPEIGRIGYHTNGYSCPHPDPSQCQASDQPLTFVWQGTRATRTDLLGNMVEAHAPGAPADVGLWADVVYEEAEVERVVDGEGQERFYVRGTNVWRRERLEDSEFALGALTPGTGVGDTAPHLGDGHYGATMTLGSVPGLNAVSISGTHQAPLIRYLNGSDGEVDPATVNPATLTIERLKDPARPISIEDTFSLWGVEAEITGVDPAPVYLGTGGIVTRSALVQHTIRPPEYATLLDPRDVELDVRASQDDTLVLNGSGADLRPFEIPAGLTLPSGDYYAQLRLEGVTSDGADLPSGRHPLPVCSLLDLNSPYVELRTVRDPFNERLCGSEGRIYFTLCRDSRVTLTIAGRTPALSINDGPPAPVVDVLLPAGLHEAIVPAGLPELDAVDRLAPFVVHATDAADPLQTAQAEGQLKNEVINRSVLPVGRTFVKGVDLLDGHVVHQATDLQVPGRHLGLELTRTYSSAGSSREGLVGAGWSFGYHSRLYEDTTCGLATVVTADGSSQVFQSNDSLQTFTPQKGYHTRLEREGIDAYVFIDKAGNRHRFDTRDPRGARRLEHIEEPHGDRLVFSYDGQTRLTRVAEVHPEAGEVRALDFEYETIFGFDRIVRAQSPALSLAVDYDYDERGNLTSCTRSGENIPEATGPATPPRVERYEYLPPHPLNPNVPPAAGAPLYDPRRDHQLAAVVDPNGSRREYVYFTEDDPPLPGEAEDGLPLDGANLTFIHRWELARQVLEFPVPGIAERTSFTYDGSQAASLARWTTTVRDGRGHDTEYLLNGNGSPLEIHEPLGRVTTMRWAADDVLKTWEKDALGRETEFEYDNRGNLTLERILTADFGPVVTQYTYDPSFNKLTFKKDAEARETTYLIDPATGDLLETTDPVGNTTVYTYDSHGRLETVTDPRRFITRHTDHDSFGNARTVTDPLDNVTTREWDTRGRMTRQSDTLGRDMSQGWDGLDRPVRVTRIAGGGSDDEKTETEYYPGGQTRLSRNPNGAETTFTLDGRNRVIATDTVFDSETLTSATTWDATGNKETETDRRGVVRRNTWDALNRLEEVEIVSGLPGEGPLGTIAEYTYDVLGNRLTETDLAGLTTGFEYDDLYRVTARILPESSPATGQPYRETYTYDLVGNVLEQRDANDHRMAYTYDGLDRRLTVTNALDQVTRFTYEEPGGQSHVNLSEEHDLTRGLRTTYLYDALNRVTERLVHLEGEGGAGATYTTSSTYDDSTHTVTVTDPRGFETVTRLDGLDRPTEQTVDPVGLALVTRTAYDGLGNRKSVTDPNDHETTFRWDGLGRLVEVTDPDDHTTVSRYDGEALKTNETDRRGIERVFTYDNVGRLRTEALAAAPLSGVPWSREIQYRDRERQRIETDARGHATTLDLDGLDRVVRETDPLGFFRLFTWDGVNRTSESDKRDAPGGGHYTTTFEYDDLDRLTKVTDPLDQVIHTLYEDAQNRRTDTDKREILAVTQLDPLGRVVSVTRAVGDPEEAVLETNEHDGNSNRTLTTDAEGRQTRFAYDAANRLEERIDGFGTPVAAATVYRYDGVGNVLEEQDARAAALGEPWSILHTYDDLDRLKTETNGEGDVTVYGYDEEGNRTSVQEPAGQVTDFAYDELGELLTVTQAAPEPGDPRPVTQYAYDETRNRIRQTDARGNVVEMEYDELDRLEKTTQDPSGFAYVTEITRFDENGNPEEVVDPKGQTTTNTYDALNRLETTTYAFAPGDTTRPWRYTAGMNYDYDENDNLERVDEFVASGPDPPGPPLTTLRAYDKLDRPKSETTTLPNGGTQTVGYAYNRNGTRETVTDPAGRATRYTYDGKNRLETVTTGFGTPEAATSTYHYYDDDLLELCTYPNGVVGAHTYDRADRLLGIINTSGPSIVSQYDYFGIDGAGDPISYDPNGNRLIQVETNGGTTETTRYTYDDLNRLKTVTYPADSIYPSGREVVYTYDAVGNRVGELEQEPGGSTILADRQGIFDSLNRLESLRDLSKPDTDPEHLTSFTWDPNGNQLTKTEGDGTPDALTTTHIYGLRDKLLQTDQATDSAPADVSTLARFQYDFDGRRNLKIGELVGGGTLRQYVYDQTSLLAEYDAIGTEEAKYDYGSDRLLSLTRTDEGRRYYTLDGLRSVVNLTDDAGSTVASYHLDAWGTFRFPTELDSSRNRFAFTGHYFDPETSLYNAKARYFDPTLGRFLTQDSFLGNADNPPSLHRYSYSHNRPTYYVDPDGEFAIIATALLIGIIAAEVDIIHQEITQGKELLTLDPRKGVDAVQAAKTGGVAAAATLAGAGVGAAALSGTAAAGIGGASGSAAVAATAGGAAAGFTGASTGALAAGATVGEALDRGAIGALAGSIGGAAGVAGGAAGGALGSRAGGTAARVAGGFAGGAAADQATQQVLVAAGAQESVNVAQSLAVGAVSAGLASGVVVESTRGNRIPPAPREGATSGSALASLPSRTSGATPSALQARLAAYKAWRARGGTSFNRFVGAHRPGSSGSTLYSPRSGFKDRASAPNPYGKLGSPAHRTKVDEVVADIQSRGLRPYREVRIRTVGGTKQHRFMDVVARDPNTGEIVEVHQIGRVLKSRPNVPVPRERTALRDVRRSPEVRKAKRAFHKY